MILDAEHVSPACVDGPSDPARVALLLVKNSPARQCVVANPSAQRSGHPLENAGSPLLALHIPPQKVLEVSPREERTNEDSSKYFSFSISADNEELPTIIPGMAMISSLDL